MSKIAWALVLASAVVLIVLAPSVGAQWISPIELIRAANTPSHQLYLSLRLPRVLLAAVAGSALAMSGVSLQALFRNVLAEPFTLGISGGAAVGASIAIFSGVSLPVVSLGAAILRSSTVFALIGALVSTAIMWGFTARRARSSSALLLCGVVLSFFYASVLMLLQYFGDFGEVFRMTHWMLGTLEVVGFSDVVILFPFIVVGGAFLFVDPEALNLMSVGDEFAQSRGVPVRSVQMRILFGVALMIGAVVSVCGPIGFVGIIVPYLCRGCIGYDQRSLLPLSAIAGAVFLVVCDTVSRTLFSPMELPAGVCTALVGAPVFIWIVLRRESDTVE